MARAHETLPNSIANPSREILETSKSAPLKIPNLYKNIALRNEDAHTRGNRLNAPNNLFASPATMASRQAFQSRRRDATIHVQRSWEKQKIHVNIVPRHELSRTNAWAGVHEAVGYTRPKMSPTRAPPREVIGLFLVAK